MSDSDAEEENFYFYGKPLEPYDEDTFPKKKPISIEDQIATDSQGRRRFHGAFTGGFSAGFFNTVGSLEGWTPSDFKSTRSDKSAKKNQKIEDFMDDEDVAEFGIAPQTVRATRDYATTKNVSKKRERQAYTEGPIPGEPVLHSLLSAGNETIGHLLLRNIGHSRAPPDASRTYGCEMPTTYEIDRLAENVAESVHIAPIYTEFLKNTKANTFGLGYVGLDKTSAHLNLFQPDRLVINEKNRKKVAISGQAFGVGAFEHEDDDIYVKDDMNRYDFELGGEKNRKKTTKNSEKTHFGDFVALKAGLPPIEQYPAPTIPASFTGKHKIKKSRFEPIREPEIARKQMNPEIRARYLGEEAPTPTASTSCAVKIKEEAPKSPKNDPKSPKNDPKTDWFGFGFDRFVSATKAEDVGDILEAVAPMETEHGTKEMRDAAKMKMFGALTRISSDWQPCALLCKRFNVPEPHCEFSSLKNRKRTKNLIFEYEQQKDEGVELGAGLNVQKSEVEAVLVDAGEKIDEKVVEIVEIPEIVEMAEIKSDSGRVIDMTEKINVDQNIDLFKAVFLSSSDEGSEEEAENDEEKNEVMKEMQANVLSDVLMANIKPIKEGILSNVDFSALSRNDAPKLSGKVEEIIDPLLYGPSLPATIYREEKKEKIVEVASSEDDEWVEKAKKSKKHKKEKHKSKKSASHKAKKRKQSKSRQ